MARRKVKRERVGMTTPAGTRVTVGADSVERFTARGFQADKPKVERKVPQKSAPADDK